ncbi:Tetratricopeptide repeat protein 39B [Halotydeus destructor]|nr:Tetratricopeptide repeat protein 39B [Halotydeus destructor]
MESRKVERQASDSSDSANKPKNTDSKKLSSSDDCKNLIDEPGNRDSDNSAVEFAESDDWPIVKQLEEGTETVRVFLRNDYVEGFKLLQRYAKVSMLHAMGSALCSTLKAVAGLRPEALAEAWKAVNYALDKIDRKRKRRSTTGYLVNSLMFRNTYDDYSDENCHAEMFYAETQAAFAALTVLQEPTLTGFVKGAIRIRACFNTFKECERIHKYKTNWETETSRDNFTSGVHLGLGLFEVAISYFPSKLITLLEMAGFAGNLTSGINQLIKGAEIQDGIRYPIVAIALGGCWGFGEFFCGIGEPNVPFIHRIVDHALTVAPEGVPVKIALAFRETTLGNFEAACHATPSSPMKIWIYAAQWRWAEASENARFLAEKCKYSPSMFTYILAVCLATQADSETDPLRKMALKEEAMECLVRVLKLKKSFGGRRAFHERLVAENAKKFIKHPNKMVLPALDLVYLWNGFRVASYSAPCLAKMVDELDGRLKTFTKEEDLEIYSYLTFMKGCAHAYSCCHNLAMDTFLEVLKHQEDMTTMKHLAPQATFEIAMIYRRLGDLDQSRAWLKRARKFGGYVTEVLIDYRINHVMELMKSEENN